MSQPATEEQMKIEALTRELQSMKVKHKQLEDRLEDQQTDRSQKLQSPSAYDKVRAKLQEQVQDQQTDRTQQLESARTYEKARSSYRIVDKNDGDVEMPAMSQFEYQIQKTKTMTMKRNRKTKSIQNSPVRQSVSTFGYQIENNQLQTVVANPSSFIPTKKKIARADTKKLSHGKSLSVIPLYFNGDSLEPDAQKAIARELYVQATVNDVKGSGKVKAGQMNFLNTRKSTSKSYLMQPSKRSQERIVAETREISGQVDTSFKIKNPYYQRKNQDTQNEFEQLMDELVQVRTGGTKIANNNLDNLVDEFYMVGPSKKHVSPVRRLIKHKNSTTAHKQKMLSTVTRGSNSQAYFVAPGKSYIVDTQDKELPYDIAGHSPRKFHGQILNQSIMKLSNKEATNIVYGQPEYRKLDLDDL